MVSPTATRPSLVLVSRICVQTPPVSRVRQWLLSRPKIYSSLQASTAIATSEQSTQRPHDAAGRLAAAHGSSFGAQTRSLVSSSTTSPKTTVNSVELENNLPHDVGGRLNDYGPIFTEDDALLNNNNDNNNGAMLLAWEQQCHALFAVLASHQVLRTDELRRAIESLTPTQYQTWSYYEKWSAAMTILLLEKGILTHDEVQEVLFGENAQERNTSAAGTDAPRFSQGNAVRVKPWSACHVEWKRPHIRTPGYVYGVTGIVERICGRYGDPSFLAFGLKAPETQLYRVRFAQSDLWPEHRHNNNNCRDVVEVEIYEHWLESADDSSSTPSSDSQPTLFDHSGGSGSDCVSHHHGDHVHEERPMVEERAIQREGPPRPGQELFQAVRTLLLQKNMLRQSDIRSMCERLDTAGQRLDGATLVVQAWQDPDFQERLLTDAPTAASELGISTLNTNAPTVLTVVPNTSDAHNLVVCTLCSCYPSGLLGIAPSWYKSRSYRARAVREPRTVLAQEFGLSLPHYKRIRVHDSTADHRYLVLPERPAGTEDCTVEELHALVTRDTMIGVAVPEVR